MGVGNTNNKKLAALQTFLSNNSGSADKILINKSSLNKLNQSNVKKDYVGLFSSCSKSQKSYAESQFTKKRQSDN
jgi:hypothetical protein